eukprot:3573904-Rhodomonas_salina.1
MEDRGEEFKVPKHAASPDLWSLHHAGDQNPFWAGGVQGRELAIPEAVSPVVYPLLHHVGCLVTPKNDAVEPDEN